MEKKNKSFWASLIERLFSDTNKKRIVKFLEKEIIKNLLKNFLSLSGLKLWLVSFVVVELIEEVDGELIEPLFRKFNLIADIHNGKTIYRRIEDAENRDDWRNTIGNS